MSFTEQRRYQDIAIINIGGKSKPKNKTNPLVTIFATVAVTLTVIIIAYCAGWRAGVFAAPCCIGPIDLQFDFEG